MSNLEEKIEDNIFLRAIEFGMKYPEGFTYMEIVKSLDLKEESNAWKKKIIGKYLHSAYLNARQTKVFEHSSNVETPFLLVGSPSGGNYKVDNNRYIVSYDAYFKYLDYKELKLARKVSKEAKKLSISAIVVSILALLASAFVPIWISQTISQTVLLDEGQFNKLESIESTLNSVGE